jgi:hypothetical protein
MKHSAASVEVIENHIVLIRGHRVMFDSHLAELYGVTTSALNQAVSRNKDRFPADFMFQLTSAELENWKSQTVISNSSTKMGLRKPPSVFTEQGVSMLSSVLRSKRAVQVNIGIMRTFVKMRETMIAHKDLSRRLNDMERKYDKQFRGVFDAIRQLMEPPPVPSKRPIGFVRDKE